MVKYIFFSLIGYILYKVEQRPPTLSVTYVVPLFACTYLFMIHLRLYNTDPWGKKKKEEFNCKLKKSTQMCSCFLISKLNFELQCSPNENE